MKALARVGIVALAILGFAVLPALTEANECVENGTLTFSGTLEGWNSSPVTCGDKIYTLIGTDLDELTAVTITRTAPNVYQLALDFAPIDLLGHSSSFFIDYSIAVADFSPDVITAVNLDVTQNCDLTGGECRVEKDIFTGDDLNDEGTLISINGSVESLTGLSTRLLTINERLSVVCDPADSGCVINSVQNTILQQPPRVPLPGTLVMLGMGLLGAGLWRYRKGA
jgi:hypothetical protein